MGSVGLKSIVEPMQASELQTDARGESPACGEHCGGENLDTHSLRL